MSRSLKCIKKIIKKLSNACVHLGNAVKALKIENNQLGGIPTKQG